MQEFLEFYREAAARLETGLARWISALPKSENPILLTGRERLYGLNGGGKRLRGTLVHIGYRMLREGWAAEADALAESYELFQTAILVHDDIIDHADRRRGMETLHSRYRRDFTPPGGEGAAAAGAALALCLGDLGLYLSQQRLAEGCGGHPRFVELLRYYNGIVIRTIEGELLDVELSEAERFGLPLPEGGSHEQMVYDIYRLKTACYTMIGPICCGLLLAGAGPDVLAEMEAVALDLGLAFQMRDDVLGIYGQAAFLGKGVGGDVSEFKQTLLYSYMKARGGADYAELLRYYGKPALSEPELDAVRSLFRAAGALDYVEGRIASLFASAREKLDAAAFPEDRKALLRGFIRFVETRQA